MFDDLYKHLGFAMVAGVQDNINARNCGVRVSQQPWQIQQAYQNAAGSLIQMGLDISKVYQNISENSSVSRMKLLGNVIQKLNYDCEGELVWFLLNHDMIKEVNGSNQDFDGFTDFFRGIKGVEVSLMLYDLGGKVRLSFRSKGKYKVSEIAKKMGGGGHPFAAAALVQGELADVKSTVLNLMSTYINSKK